MNTIESKRNMKRYQVHNVGPGSLSPLFSGSKTECLRFMAHALGAGGQVELLIRRVQS